MTKDDVEPVTWAIIERGRATSGIRHISDVEAVRTLGRAVAMDLHAYDVFLTPTLTQLPRPVGHYDMSETDLDRYNAQWTDGVFTFPFNMSGQPAISIPVGCRQSACRSASSCRPLRRRGDDPGAGAVLEAGDAVEGPAAAGQP